MFSLRIVTPIVLSMFLASLVEPLVAQDSSAKTAQTSTIVAEGVGTSADEALKDAFRNAVRQEVGALVDAETLVKNDEIIDDKVLTYSDGFIKTYEEVAGSKKIQGGLHRIKVKAQVERRSVIAKLKESKVSVKEIDGKGLFAEVVTGEEARQNSTEIVKKALADLHKLWVAEPIGKPDFDKQTSEVVVKVGVKIDAAKYKAFFEKVSPILDKVALRKTTFMSKGESRGNKTEINDPIERLFIASRSFEDKPLSKEESKTQWKLLLCHPPRSDVSSLRWTLYIVDAAASDVLSPIELPVEPRELLDSQKPINDSPARLIIELYNSAGDIVTENDTIIRRGHYYTYNSRIQGVDDFCPGLSTCLEGYSGGGAVHSFNMAQSKDVQSAIVNKSTFLKEKDPYGHESRNGQPYFRTYVGPFIFTDKGNHTGIGYRPVAEYERRIKVSLEELKAVQSVRCKLVRE